MRRQHRYQPLIVTAARIGEAKRTTVYTARQAAQKAVALAGKGFRVAVIAERDGNLKMTCIPVPRGADRYNIASCDVDPTFKRQIKGLAGLAGLHARRRRW